MAATMSPWGKPGAWALDSEKHEAELQQLKEKEAAEPLPDFPSLAAAATTKPKKKKGQTVSLAEFTTYGGARPMASNTNEPRGLTHEDRMMLPTGPRERSAEELDRNRLGGGFRSYGSNDRNNKYSNGDESSNPRWGSSKSERNGGGGFGRAANRDSGSSPADEIDNWAAAKKSPTLSGFERKDRGGFFDSESKADKSDSWVSNKSFVPSEGRRFGSSGGGFEKERRVGFTSNGGGADSDNWGKKKEESNGVTTVNGTETGRPRLNLQPRTLPVSDGGSHGSGTVVVAKPKGSNPFGDARPREDVLAEKGQDWKKIDEQLESKVKQTNEKAADGGSSFGKRSFGIGNGRTGFSSDRAEKTWRKPDVSDARPTSAEEIENGNSEEIENGNSEEIEDVNEN